MTVEATERAAVKSTNLDCLAPSFELHLRAEGKSVKTVRIYLTALRHFGAWAQDRYPDLSDWQAVRRDHLRQWAAETIESSARHGDDHPSAGRDGMSDGCTRCPLVKPMPATRHRSCRLAQRTFSGAVGRDPRGSFWLPEPTSCSVPLAVPSACLARR